MLTISIEFLMGRYVAEETQSHKTAEWPPHPGRLFMAMVASYFEGGENSHEKDALLWFERCEPPTIYYNQGNKPRSTVKTYVPINDDILQYKKLQPLLTTVEMPVRRLRKERTFSSTIVGYEPLYFIWDELDCNRHMDSLISLCGRIHRLGHSSSFVYIKASKSEPKSLTELDENNSSNNTKTNKSKMISSIVPDKNGKYKIRWVSKGTLKRLESAFAIEVSKTSAAKIKRRYYERNARLNSINLPTITYSNEIKQSIAPQRMFADMQVLPLINNKRINLIHTLEIVQEVRNIIQGTNPPEYISGLAKDGNTSNNAHLSIVPLAFVSHRHSDGNIRGMGIMLPHENYVECIKYISQALSSKSTSEEEITVQSENFGKVKFSLYVEHKIKTLDANSWQKPSTMWATVTPIVVNKILHSDHTKWNDEIRQIIAKSCKEQNLPNVAVSISNIAFHLGVPTANMFPRYAKNKTQVHAILQFDEKVSGPLILGDGKYNGYGLCKPWWKQK